ncbi:MAG: MlaD family protein, partial [bacterium]
MNMDQEMDEQPLAPPEIPSAIVVPSNADRPTKWWWLTAGCVLVSVSLFFYSQQTIGEPIVIEFLDGYGIKPEDRLKHHGIDVGQVEKVELSSELDRVLVHVRLQRNASTLARDGTQFWIVRPTFSIDSVGGLETILGAKYLAVAPGPAKGPKASRFLGLETPPVASAKDGSLEILLDSGTRGGLSNGAPILYRGYKIGSVLQVGLATDARSVRARCAIEPE